MIAGHLFTSEGRCSCGKRLSDISFVYGDRSWIGQPDIAHTGLLNEAEYGQICGEVERIFAAVAA